MDSFELPTAAGAKNRNNSMVLYAIAATISTAVIATVVGGTIYAIRPASSSANTVASTSTADATDATTIEVLRATTQPNISIQALRQSFFDGVIPPIRAIPNEVTIAAANAVVEQKSITVDGIKVTYREAGATSNSLVSLLLLDATPDGSEVFDRIGTIALFAAAGYRVCAIDLPGSGQTPAGDVRDRGQFLSNLLDALQMTRPVVVSPDESGAYVIPLLIRSPPRMVGFVPISTAGTIFLFDSRICFGFPPKQKAHLPKQLRSFLQPPYRNLDCITTPSLVIWGELDLAVASARVSLLPVAGHFQIFGAGHRAAVDQPFVWHRLLFFFMKKVDQQVTSEMSANLSEQSID